ncbi:hypothetical protein GCM10023310_02460 [Paenibacillus vulneris]
MYNPNRLDKINTDSVVFTTLLGLSLVQSKTRKLETMGSVKAVHTHYGDCLCNLPKGFLSNNSPSVARLYTG